MPLFKSYTLASLELPNRIVMSAMTRSRADDAGIPSGLTALYYAQRATAGLIVTGSINISPQARGYLWTEGLYTDEQVHAWHAITDAVHAHGGRIAAQLIHCGRVSHMSLQPGRAQPYGVSDQAAAAEVFTFTNAGRPGMVACSSPRPLSPSAAEDVVSQFANAAIRAQRAGFDAVEVQGGNGFLVEQFLHPHVNTRADRYGGSDEARARFLYEVVDAIALAAPGLVIGVKLTPGGVINGMPATGDWSARYLRLLDGLGARNVAYVALANQAAVGADGGYDERFADQARKAFPRTLIIGGGFTGQTARAAIRDGRADLVAFGRPYLANPDLVPRIAAGHPLAEADPSTFYGGGAEGYTDYPDFDPAAADLARR